jgi:glycosyltransferase involved in cell wall biosynthesis
LKRRRFTPEASSGAAALADGVGLSSRGTLYSGMSLRVTILTGIFPPDIGGPATSVPNLAEALSRDGRQVVVITLADDPGVAEAHQYPVVRIPRKMARLRRARDVVQAIRLTKPDIVLANGLHLESALIVGVPIIQKIVGDWAWERSQNKGWTSLDVETFQRMQLRPNARAVRLLRSAVARRASLVIVPSKYVRRLVGSWGIPKARIRVVPNAAPPPMGSGATPLPRLLFAGRLVRWKHVDHVIRVLPRLPDLAFDIVGMGPKGSELQRLSQRLGLGDRVLFHGALPRNAVLEMMQRSASLVLPSSYEGMPHVVLEAFAARLPVVASDAGGIPELVEHDVSGLIYPCGDLQALESVLKVVTVPGVARRVTLGGVAVAERLTTEANVRATSAVLEEALE